MKERTFGACLRNRKREREREREREERRERERGQIAFNLVT